MLQKQNAVFLCSRAVAAFAPCGNTFNCKEKGVHSLPVEICLIVKRKGCVLSAAGSPLRGPFFSGNINGNNVIIH